jgi:hypothetical protein
MTVLFTTSNLVKLLTLQRRAVKKYHHISAHLKKINKKSASFGRSFLLQLTVFTMVSAPSQFVAEISADGHTAGKTQFEV